MTSAGFSAFRKVWIACGVRPPAMPAAAAGHSGRSAAPAASEQPRNLDLRRLDFLEFRVGVAHAQRLGGHLQIPLRRNHHDLARQLPFERIQFRLRLRRHQNRIPSDHAIGPRRPCLRYGDDRLVLRLQHVSRIELEVPSLAERSPLLQVDIGEAVFLEPLHGPFSGCPVSLRIVQTRAVHIGEVEHVVHHLGIPAQCFFLDSMDRGEIDLLGLLRDGQQGSEEKQGCDKQDFLHRALSV